MGVCQSTPPTMKDNEAIAADAATLTSAEDVTKALEALAPGDKQKVMSTMVKPKIYQFKHTDSDPPTKDLGKAKMWINKADDGRTFTRIKLEPGFDWREKVKPILPGNPDWCPATHFGYLESGSMGVLMQDGTEITVNKGETYCIPPGHLPKISEPCVMIEFAQDVTLTNLAEGKSDEKKMEPVPPTLFQCAPCDDGEPTKIMENLKMFMTKKECGRQVARVCVCAGFDWTKTIKPILPGNPDWCPVTHFGYLEKGSMTVKMQDGSIATINAGEHYLVPPGHRPDFKEDTIFVEFSQDTILRDIASK